MSYHDQSCVLLQEVNKSHSRVCIKDSVGYDSQRNDVVVNYLVIGGTSQIDQFSNISYQATTLETHIASVFIRQVYSVLEKLVYILLLSKTCVLSIVFTRSSPHAMGVVQFPSPCFYAWSHVTDTTVRKSNKSKINCPSIHLCTYLYSQSFPRKNCYPIS